VTRSTSEILTLANCTNKQIKYKNICYAPCSNNTNSRDSRRIALFLVRLWVLIPLGLIWNGQRSSETRHRVGWVKNVKKVIYHNSCKNKIVLANDYILKAHSHSKSEVQTELPLSVNAVFE
jgi:hypothetical protein